MLNSILEKLKKMKIKRALYPAAILVFLLIILTIFLKTAEFLYKNINRPFSVNEAFLESQLTRINFGDYELLSKKLGFTFPVAPAPQLPEILPSPEVLPSEEPTSTPTTTEFQTEENKQDLKIAIFNTTLASGLASQLKEQLEEKGFLVQRIGNESPTLEQTTIQIKEAVKNSPFVEEIKQIVSEEYLLSEIQTLTEESEYDVLILIGQE